MIIKPTIYMFIRVSKLDNFYVEILSYCIFLKKNLDRLLGPARLLGR